MSAAKKLTNPRRAVPARSPVALLEAQAAACMEAHHRTTQYVTALIQLREAVREAAPELAGFVESPYQVAMKAAVVTWAIEAQAAAHAQQAIDAAVDLGASGDDEPAA